MVGEIVGKTTNTFRKRIHLSRILKSYFLGENRVQFSRITELGVALSNVFNSYFVNLEWVDPLTVLIYKLHNILQEAVQTLALEIQADQITRVVPISL